MMPLICMGRMFFQLMLLPRNFFVWYLEKYFALGILPRKLNPDFGHSIGHHLKSFGEQESIINQLLEVGNSILGLILHSSLKMQDFDPR